MTRFFWFPGQDSTKAKSEKPSRTSDADTTNDSDDEASAILYQLGIWFVVIFVGYYLFNYQKPLFMYVSVEQMFEKCPEGLVYAQGIAYRDSVLGLILSTIACIITAYLMKVSHNEEIDKLHEMYASQLSDRDSIYKDCREDAEKRLRMLTEYASKSINSHARMQRMALELQEVHMKLDARKHEADTEVKVSAYHPLRAVYQYSTFNSWGLRNKLPVLHVQIWLKHWPSYFEFFDKNSHKDSAEVGKNKKA